MRCVVSWRSAGVSCGIGVLLLLAATLCACNAQPQGEWDPAQCRDGLDNDRDGLTDCADPDCWAFACPSPPLTPMPAPEAGSGGAAPTIDAGHVAMPVVDARVVEPPGRDTDSGMTDEEDASVPLPPACSTLLCKAGEMCVDGQCKPVDITGSYVLEVVSAVVPDLTLDGLCFDPDVLCALGCVGGCLPDPYVVVTKNSVVHVGRTLQITDTTTPKWMLAKYDVTLTNSDALVFAVWDADALGNMDIFSCSPDLPVQVPTGILRCSPTARSTIEPGANGPYEIVAHITRK